MPCCHLSGITVKYELLFQVFLQKITPDHIGLTIAKTINVDKELTNYSKRFLINLVFPK